MPVSTQHYLLLQRNLLYTAITRARRLVVLIGTKKALTIAIRNNKQQLRYTYLAQRLRA
jgi:exodeoxyribonuclease V alpha subunit